MKIGTPALGELDAVKHFLDLIAGECILFIERQRALVTRGVTLLLKGVPAVRLKRGINVLSSGYFRVVPEVFDGS